MVGQPKEYKTKADGALVIPLDHPALRGNGVLPEALLLDWAQALIGKEMGLRVKSVLRARFPKPARAGAPLRGEMVRGSAPDGRDFLVDARLGPEGAEAMAAQFLCEIDPGWGA